MSDPNEKRPAPTDRPPQRGQHRQFKYAIVGLAIHEPRRLIELCSGDTARLRELWDLCGEGLAPEECCPGEGLAAQVRGPTERPLVVVIFPAPVRDTEAFFVWAVPADVPELRYRVFGLEKAAMPTTGEPLTFVVEWDGKVRCNYGPPTDDHPNDQSLGGLAGAILAIAEGSRKPYATTERPVPLPPAG